jgi:hypothetical protein
LAGRDGCRAAALSGGTVVSVAALPSNGQEVEMPHRSYVVVRVPAGSLEEAHEIIGRLTGAGFARNSMKAGADAEGTFHVAVHTSPANHDRVMHIAEGGFGSRLNVGVSNTTLALIVGGAAVLGAGVWAAWKSKMVPKSLPFPGQTGDDGGEQRFSRGNASDMVLGTDRSSGEQRRDSDLGTTNPPHPRGAGTSTGFATGVTTGVTADQARAGDKSKLAPSVKGAANVI